jgi:hypothetical protein
LPPAFARRGPGLEPGLGAPPPTANGSSHGHGAGLLNRARNVVRAAYGFRGVKRDVLQQRAQQMIDAMTVGYLLIQLTSWYSTSNDTRGTKQF